MSTKVPGWVVNPNTKLEFVPLGRLVRLRNEKNDPIRMTQVLSLTADRGVIRYEDKGAVGNNASEDISRYSIVRKGDIVVNSMNVIIGSVGLSKYDGVLSPVYYVLTPLENDLVDMRYLAYHFQVKSFQQSLIRIGYGILDHRMRIPWINLKAELIALPPLEEQRRIADYLDQQVPRIDQAVLLFRRQLATSSLAFMSKVEHQTSARLNPADPFRRFRRLGKVDPITSIAGLEGDVTFLGLEDVQPGKLGDFSNTRNVDGVSSGYSRFKSGDILIPKVSPSFGHGRAVVATALVSSVGFASTEVYVFRSNDPGDWDYICGSFRARDFLLAGEATYQGVAGVKRVDRDFILDWPIRWPDRQTREAVAAKIQKGQQDLENLDFKTDVAVASLRELRSSLITAAVTGTFDVTTGRSVA